MCLTTYFISPPWNVWDALKKICPLHGSTLGSAFHLHRMCCPLCSASSHHLTPLPILLGLRVDMFKGPDTYCQIALPRDCATYIPISSKGVSISPHSHGHGAVLFDNLISGDTFQLVLQSHTFKQPSTLCKSQHTIVEELTITHNCTGILGFR
ncbi:hypothetical protein HJG60_008774 [Phyllostomus discolor]|uniref:Uncharacterized protein n=1 Tax=Phyllostomus discolor TaxID=89673 RepID=A0A833YZ02_9CHIR|nr:hypothetical protein HJG60_008774 [Phyllostomus discolor]